MDRVLAMVTTAPAKVLGLEAYGLEVGAQANLVVLGATSWHDAIQFQPARRKVILRGRLAAATRVETEIYL